MIKHAWTVLCRRSSIDKDSNNISISDVLERLQVNVKPELVEGKDAFTLPVEYEIVSLLYRDSKGKEEEVSLRVEFRDPEDKNLSKTDFNIIVKPEHLRMRNRSRIKGLILNETGTYTFLLSVKQGNSKYKEVARIPLEVHIAKATKQNSTIKSEIN